MVLRLALLTVAGIQYLLQSLGCDGRQGMHLLFRDLAVRERERDRGSLEKNWLIISMGKTKLLYTTRDTEPEKGKQAAYRQCSPLNI